MLFGSFYKVKFCLFYKIKFCLFSFVYAQGLSRYNIVCTNKASFVKKEMRSAKSVAGKIFNQAPYDPKLYKYHNVLPTGFSRAAVVKPGKVTANTEKVQGKLMNSGVYDPKLNKYGITSQNYKKQLEKVQADTAIKQDLTDRVTEASAGDRMDLERKKKNYAPILEQIASTGIVVSKSITNPGDVVELLRDTIAETKKSVPKSQWSKAIPEAIKTIALALVDQVRLGEIPPERIPEFVEAIETDSELSSDDPYGGEEFFIDDPAEDIPDGEEGYDILNDMVRRYFVPLDLFGVRSYNKFKTRFLEGMRALKADRAYERIAAEFNVVALQAALFAIMTSTLTEPGPIDADTRAEWLNRAIYGEEAVEEEEEEEAVDIPEEEEEVEEEEAVETTPEEEFIDPDARGDRMYERLMEEGRTLIDSANPGTDWVDLYEVLIGNVEGSIMSDMIRAGVDPIDRGEANLEFQRLLAEKMTELEVDDDIFEQLNLEPTTLEEEEEEEEVAPEAEIPSGAPGIIDIDEDGNIMHMTYGNIGKFNEAKGTAKFIDGTGDSVTYNITKDELENELKNGGDTATAMINSNPGWLPNYKTINIRGKILRNGYAILQHKSSARANAIFGVGGGIFRIEPLNDKVKLVENEYTIGSDYEEKRGALNITIPRKLFVAWVLVTSGELTEDEKEKAIKVIDAYNRPRYDNIYEKFKRFIGAISITAADLARDAVGFGKKKKTTPSKLVAIGNRSLFAGANGRTNIKAMPTRGIAHYNSIVSELDKQIRGGKINRAQYVKVMRKLTAL